MLDISPSKFRIQKQSWCDPCLERWSDLLQQRFKLYSPLISPTAGVWWSVGFTMFRCMEMAFSSGTIIFTVFCFVLFLIYKCVQYKSPVLFHSKEVSILMNSFLEVFTIFNLYHIPRNLCIMYFLAFQNSLLIISWCLKFSFNSSSFFGVKLICCSFHCFTELDLSLASMLQAVIVHMQETGIKLNIWS